MPDYESSLKKIAKGAGIAIIGVFFSKLFSYLFRFIGARYGANEYGLFTLSLTLAAFMVVICTLGLEKGLLRYIPQFLEENKPNKIKGIIKTAISYSLILSLIITIPLIIFTPWIHQTFFKNITSPHFQIILRIILLTIPLHTILRIFTYSFRAFNKNEYEVYTRSLVEGGLKFILGLLIFFLGYSIISLSAIYSISILIAFIVGLFYLKKSFPDLTSKLKPEYFSKELLKYSLPLISTGIFITLIASIDTFMLAYFKNEYAVGIYNTVVPIGQLMYIVPFAILTLFIPVMTRLYTNNKKQEFKQLYKTISKWIAKSSLLILILIYLYPKELLGLMFGPEYVVGSTALIILATGYFLNFLVFSSESILMVLKKTKLILYNSIIISIINIILNYFLIKVHGIEGAATATAISFIIWGIVLFSESYYLTKIIPFKLSLVKILISGLITLIIFVFINTTTLSKLIFLLYMILTSSLYIILLLITKSFDKEDVLIIKYFQEKTKIKIPLLNKILIKFIER